MKISALILNEFKLLSKSYGVWVWMIAILSLSTVAVFNGLSEVNQQRSTIERLVHLDEIEREELSSKQKSWGSAAYYLFSLTYDEPSNFAFAALGARDTQPWMHRIRMLALEGQIYERETSNPIFSITGRLDFAFLSAFVLPLFVIFLLFDLISSEKRQGRYTLLIATARNQQTLWFTRILIRFIAIYVSVMLPLWIAEAIEKTPATILVTSSLLVFIYILFWVFVTYVLAKLIENGTTILVSLIALWLTLAVIIPSASRIAIDEYVKVPAGADLLLLQRETVNDAWDLPRQATMKPFFERHPEWSDYVPIKSSFEWQWYYAFQQVGDQTAEPLTNAFINGRLERDRLASILAIFSPPVLLERQFESLAETSMQSAISYEQRVREFHGQLRGFYYPKLFRNQPFSQEELSHLPKFEQ